MMSRSYAYIDRNLVFFRNKYVWVLLLELCMAASILRGLKAQDPADRQVSPPSTSG